MNRQVLSIVGRVFLSLAFIAIVASSWTVADAQVEKAKNNENNLSFDWPKIPKAKSYEIEFKSKSDKFKFTTKENKWAGYIPPGRYEFRLRSRDSIGAPGPWSGKVPLTIKLPAVELSAPSRDSKIKSKSIKKHKVKFEWAKHPNAQLYKVTVLNDENDTVVQKQTEAGSLRASLPVAKDYKWHVVAVSPEGDIGAEAKTPLGFGIDGGRLPKPKISKVDLNDSKDLEWGESPRAEKYDVLIQHKKKGSKKYKTMKKMKGLTDKNVEFDEKWPVGKYKLKVRAKANRFVDSKYSSKSFRFDGTKKSDVVWNDRSGFLVGVEYAPFRRYFNISSDQVDIQVAQTVLNSWRLHLDYQIIGLHNDFGVGMFGQSTGGTLFETEDGEPNENGQIAIETNADDIGLQLWDNYRLIGPFGIHGALQIVKRTVFSLYAESLSTFALVENNTLESVFNGGINARLSQDSILIVRLGYGKPFIGTQETEDFGHILAAAGLNHWLSNTLVMRYSYDYSKFSFIAEPPNGGDALTFSSSHHTMGFNLGYLF